MVEQQCDHQVMKVIDAGNLRKMGQSNDSLRRLFRFDSLQQGHGLGLDARPLLMHVGWKKPKARLLETESAAGLGDAALAQDQGLSAIGESLAYNRPFFQGVLQHGSSFARGRQPFLVDRHTLDFGLGGTL
jgi:hypothetical protein